MKVKFKGLMGEDLVVGIVKHGDHNHLEVYHNGRMLWFAHLMKNAINLRDGKFYSNEQPPEPKNNIFLRLGGLLE